MTTRPPGLESRSMDLTFVHEWNDGKTRRFQDYLVREEPMEIRIGKHSLSVTMRTPGNDLELAAGFLFTEGLIHRREEIEVIEHAETGKPSETGNVVRIEISRDVEIDLEGTQRNFFAASSCGICGKASLDSVRLRGMRPPEGSLRLDPELLCGMPDVLRASQVVFSRTGGLHAAGLFDAQGRLVVQREDVGRHNAVDKVIGWALAQWLHPAFEICLARKRSRRFRNYSEGRCRRRADRRIGFRTIRISSTAGAGNGPHPRGLPEGKTVHRVFRGQSLVASGLRPSQLEHCVCPAAVVDRRDWWLRIRQPYLSWADACVGIRKCIQIVGVAEIQAGKVFFYNEIKISNRTKIDRSINSNQIAFRPGCCLALWKNNRDLRGLISDCCARQIGLVLECICQP